VVKILAFTDPHGELPHARGILDLAARERPDIVLCAGDFSYFGMKYDEFLKALASLRQPIYFVTGNHETDETSKVVQKRYPFMREVTYQTMEVCGVHIAGVPGSGEYWPGENEDEGVLETAVGLWGNLDRSLPFVFLSHFPPCGTAIDGTTDMTPDSGGSQAVRRIVEILKPSLVVSGHYHHDFGKRDRMGAVNLVNPGPAGTILHL
jgi:Icc-related predicted phosphoesterase